MHFISDLHIHSRYSRATSKNLDLESLYQWAQIKGINVVGTGDFTHPEWFKELQNKLEPDGSGFFRLKNPPKNPGLPGLITNETDVRFCLSSEISSIYKFGERVRKNHNLVYAPDFDTVKRINARLAEIGNLASDGRPILGLPSHDLLEIVLETSDDAHLIPAHVWTPWFSTLGSKAGYDSIEECFRDLSQHIFALETGLSSDPEMNWKVSSLDKYTLVSNSDAHSPQKLGREANLFDTERSYFAMFEAIKTKKGFKGTYEFFPEEGKYHMDGHRKCNVCMEPRESISHNEICPVCGKPLTIGVLNRVEKLADRELPEKPAGAPGFEYIIPLPEIIAEFTGTGPASKGVQQNFIKTISRFGNEFDLLQTIPFDEIKSKGGELLAEAIRRLRSREVNPKAGYDGEYGTISIFNPGEMEKITGQTDLFGGSLIRKNKQRKAKKQKLQPKQSLVKENIRHKLNEEQLLAVENEENTLVTAGPGTGKTNTLVQWIIYQVEKKKLPPEQIIAITFTNKAADELGERLAKKIGEKSKKILCGTFHAVAYSFLRKIKPEITTIYDANNRKQVLAILFPEMKKTEIKKLSVACEAFFEGVANKNSNDFRQQLDAYHAYLDEHKAVDLSAIIAQTNALLKNNVDAVAGNYQCLAVDEFQDINPVQYDFVKLLAAGKRIFAIGDPNQSIYGFRGSDMKLFFRAKDDFGAEEIFLKKNYRTPLPILNAATMLIQKNEYRANVTPEATKLSGSRAGIFAAKDEKLEAKFIAEKVLHYIGGTDTATTGQALSDYNYAFSDIAVLFRSHNIGREIARTLRNYGIPVVVSDGTSFFLEPPFNTIAAAMQLLENPHNIVALSELLITVARLPEKQIPGLLRRYIDEIVTLEEMTSSGNWKEWMKRYTILQPAFETAGTGVLLQQLCDFLLPTELDESEQLKREILLQSAKEWTETPVDFLRRQILSPYTDAARYKNAGVRLMTFHASKGMEFPVVFIAGAEEGVAPVNREDADIEEERRLFYVAVTRAKEMLHITHAGTRTVFGKEKEMQVSRFVGEIDEKLFEKDEPGAKKKQKPTDQQLSLF